MSTPTASSPVYMMLTQPSFDANTNNDIRACPDHRQLHSKATSIQAITFALRCHARTRSSSTQVTDFLIIIIIIIIINEND